MNVTTSAPSLVSRVLLIAGGVFLAVGIFLAVRLFRSDSQVSNSEQVPKGDLAKEAMEDLYRRDYRPLSGDLMALLDESTYKSIPTQAHPLLGMQAPDFQLRDTNGHTVSLSETVQKGPVVLVFYYGYHCDHCVSQLFGLNKDLERFQELGATVLAISGDKPELTRQRFQQYGSFAFPVLSDPGNAVAEKFGTFTPPKQTGEEGDLMHGTFVINRDGKILWANRGDGPFTENRTLLIEVNRCLKGKRSEPAKSP